MHCPFCKHTDTRVLDSRVADDGGAIRRRRACQACDRRFTTVEQIQLVVVKRSGASEPFNRDKVIDGVRKACKGRPVTDDDLARLGQEVETALRAAGAAYVPADEVGLAVLEPLRELDAVAYLRFASVYKAFESVDDFADEVAGLMAERAGDPPPDGTVGTGTGTGTAYTRRGGAQGKTRPAGGTTFLSSTQLRPVVAMTDETNRSRRTT